MYNSLQNCQENIYIGSFRLHAINQTCMGDRVLNKQLIFSLMVLFAYVGHMEVSVLSWDCFTASLNSLFNCLLQALSTQWFGHTVFCPQTSGENEMLHLQKYSGGLTDKLPAQDD